METLDKKTIAGRITFAVLIIHLVVLPMLYFAVVILVKQSNEELFINNVRIHARFIADSLERLEKIESGETIVDILDSVVLSGDGVFAELSNDSVHWQSSLIDDEAGLNYLEDFTFGGHDDSVYFLSVPVVTGDSEYSLMLGFNEVPIVEANRQAYLRGLAILVAYLIIVLSLVALIGRRVMRPINALRVSSRNIASGQLAEHLTVDTDLIEFVELTRDLESMRNHLIGINQQLQEEIRQKERSESGRKQLEQQLRHKQRLETIGTLAGGIAHELNNIMVPILLYSESAMEDLDASNPVRDDLHRVVRAAARARSIVQQVLTFSRQMAPMETMPVDLSEVVVESLDLVGASFSPNVELQMKIDPSCPKVLGNASLLGQVVINLCTNAYQSLPEGKGKIKVSLEKKLLDADQLQGKQILRKGLYVALRIEDSGQGMDDETLERIFEPFFTTRNVGEGTGLGLSVVHGIVTNMEGEIIVVSDPGCGTAFEVYFPALSTQVRAA